MRITKLHIILVAIVMGFGAVFAYQYQVERKRQAAIVEEQRRRTEEERRARIQKEQMKLSASKAVAVAGGHRLSCKKEGKDIAAAQETLRGAKASLSLEDYAQAEALARQSIEEFKLAKIVSVYYTVRRGDSLWKIAKMPKHYGKGSMWPVIWRANESKIADFDVLRTRQVLLIPKTESEIKKNMRVKRI
jgi:nucleoid-associated protein YgaU